MWAWGKESQREILELNPHILMGILYTDKGAREILETENHLWRENDTCSIVVTVRWFSIDIQHSAYKGDGGSSLKEEENVMLIKGLVDHK